MPRSKDQQAIEDFNQSIVALVRRIRAAAPDIMHSLSWTQRSVLARLENEGPLSSAVLARAEGIKPQSMGTALTSLEELGFVERRPHPSDGRQILLSLTSRGRALRKGSREAKEGWMNAALEELKNDERAVLFKAGKIIRRMVERSFTHPSVADTNS